MIETENENALIQQFIGQTCISSCSRNQIPKTSVILKLSGFKRSSINLHVFLNVQNVLKYLFIYNLWFSVQQKNAFFFKSSCQKNSKPPDLSPVKGSKNAPQLLSAATDLCVSTSTSFIRTGAFWSEQKRETTYLCGRKCQLNKNGVLVICGRAGFNKPQYNALKQKLCKFNKII